MRGFIRRRGPSWELRVYLGSHPVTGTKQYATRTVRGTRHDAERVLRSMVDAVEQDAAGHANATFGELCEAWLTAVAGRLAPNTVVETRRILDRFLLPTLGEVRLRRLRSEHLDHLCAQLLHHGGRDGKPLAQGTVLRVYGVARRALRIGVLWGWITANPANAITPPRDHPRPIRPPSPDEVGRLIAATRSANPALASCLVVAVTTGARRGELCGLRWTDIDLERGTLDIVRAIVLVNSTPQVMPTKSRRPRRIALDPLTATELAAHRARAEQHATAAGVTLAADAFVFSHHPAGSQPWRPDSVTRAFRRLARRNGLDGVRFHDLRHYVATQLLTAGVDVRTVAGRLGHAHPSTTLNVYAAFLPHADQHAAALMGQLLQ